MRRGGGSKNAGHSCEGEKRHPGRSGGGGEVGARGREEWQTAGVRRVPEKKKKKKSSKDRRVGRDCEPVG